MKNKLKEEIERVAGRKIKTPQDFDWLSERVTERTKVRLSSTTLKRLFGYLDEPVTPRAFTLNVLAHFVGYKDYESFCKGVDSLLNQSDLVFSENISSDEIGEGQQLVLSWRPDRRCVIEHCGEGRFIIREVENTKLSVGDTFVCHLFIAHEPLYMSKLIHNNSCVPALYIAGRKDGIMFELPTEKKEK